MDNKDIKKEITYDSLLKADIASVNKQENNNPNMMTIIKVIAITIVLFAIIFGSLILFRKVG